MKNNEKIAQQILEQVLSTSSTTQQMIDILQKTLCITQQMIDHSDARTKMHIGLVQKYCERIADLNPYFDNLVLQSEVHDNSKFLEPEYVPYIFINWNYQCIANKVPYSIPDLVKQSTFDATFHHIKNNAHHPEFHSKQEVDILNTKDRDKPLEQIVDATAMPILSIAEMCADWCAVSEERKSSPIDWANNNIGVRWLFDDKQTKLIYLLLEKIFK
jgi:hypothetical protein